MSSLHHSETLWSSNTNYTANDTANYTANYTLNYMQIQG